MGMKWSHGSSIWHQDCGVPCGSGIGTCICAAEPVVPSGGAGGCQQHPPGRDALELAPAMLWLAWLWLPHSYLSSEQPGGGSRCLAQLPESGGGAAALLSCSEQDWRWRSAPFPQTPLAQLWPVLPDPSTPSRQAHEVISRRGHPTGHGRGPARGPACVRGPSPAGQGGQRGSGRGSGVG